MSTDYNNLITAADVAVLLPVSRATVYRMAERNEIPCVRIGGRIFFDRESVCCALGLSGAGLSENAAAEA